MMIAGGRWPITKLKRVTYRIAGGTPESDNEAYWCDPTDESATAWVAIGDMSQRQVVTSTTRAVTSAGLTSKRLTVGRPGTVLLAMYASVGEVATLGVPAAWNQAILGLNCLRGAFDSRYLGYLLRSMKPDLVGMTRSNTQDNLNAEQVGNLEIPCPPIGAQSAIADFLDRETAKIDALIEKQTSLLARTTERARRVMAEAVTGQGTGRRVKRANLPWLDGVPEEWGVERVGYHFDVVLGKMLDAGQEPRPGDEEVPYLRAANIQPDRVDLEDLNQMPFALDELRRFSLRSGDLLVVEGGSVGTSWLLRDDMPGIAFQKTLNRVRSRGDASTHFLHYVLRWLKETGVIDLICDGSTIAHLTAEKLRALRIPFPPLEEQRAIADHLDRVMVGGATLVESVHRSIALAQERRAALITAAVTGQLDISTGKVA